MEKESMETEKVWSDTLSEYLQDIKMTWSDLREVADDRSPWKSCVTQCVSD